MVWSINYSYISNQENHLLLVPIYRCSIKVSSKLAFALFHQVVGVFEIYWKSFYFYSYYYYFFFFFVNWNTQLYIRISYIHSIGQASASWFPLSLFLPPTIIPIRVLIWIRILVQSMPTPGTNPQTLCFSATISLPLLSYLAQNSEFHATVGISFGWPLLANHIVPLPITKTAIACWQDKYQGLKHLVQQGYSHFSCRNVYIHYR